MRRDHLFAFLFLSAAAVPTVLGCQPNLGAGGQGGGPGGGSGVGSGNGSGLTPAASGNARRADGGVVVTLANYGLTCGEFPLFPYECDTQVWWHAELQLTTADLVPGTKLPLTQALGYLTRQGAFPTPPGDEGCGPSAGPIGQGTVEVVAVSATELTLVVDGHSPSADDGMDGQYVVSLCDGVPPADDGAAIAMKQSEVPRDKIDPPPDPDELLVLLSNRGQSCVDPDHDADECATPRYQVRILLPASQQTIGTFALDAALVTTDGKSFPGACYSVEDGPFQSGTIDITSIDATGVTFALAGTSPIGAGFGNIDGTYTAPRCF